MRTIIFIAVVLMAFYASQAQQLTGDPQVESLYKELISKNPPEVQKWAKEIAQKLQGQEVYLGNIKTSPYGAFSKHSKADQNLLYFLVVAESYRANKAELQLLQRSKKPDPKQVREVQARMSKQQETLASSVLKKKDDTASGVIQKVG